MTVKPGQIWYRADVPKTTCLVLERDSLFNDKIIYRCYNFYLKSIIPLVADENNEKLKRYKLIADVEYN